MLPKPEKIKKNSQNSEQLDLVDTLSQENKVAKKRRFTLIFLILTVGLSIGFWTYRTCRYYIDSKTFPKINFSLPIIKPSLDIKSSSSNLNSTVLSLIGKDKNHWSIYVKTISSNKTPFEYSLNTLDISNINEIEKNIVKQAVSINSLTQSNLPQGTQVQEIISNQNNLFELNSLVTVPQKQILFVIKISGDNLENSKKTIPAVIEKIYWQLMNSDK